MFARLFGQKAREQKEQKRIARALYAAALTNTREPFFYEVCGVPDSFDGRFDLLLLHVYLILDTLMGREDYDGISQALFDEMFKDMDQTLREMSIGDMGVPKHMKRMMKAFNGRMHGYQLAIAPEKLEGHDVEGMEPAPLDEVLRRNLYGTLDDTVFSEDAREQVTCFIHKNRAAITAEALLSGDVQFINEGC